MAFSLYLYEPSVTAPIVLVALFAVTTGIHAFQMFWTRTWFFIPFFSGGLCKLGLPLPVSDQPFQ
jgi:hypothetical protein